MMIKCKCGHMVRTSDYRNNSVRRVEVCFRCQWGKLNKPVLTGPTADKSPVEQAKERLRAARGQDLNTINQFKRRG